MSSAATKSQWNLDEMIHLFKEFPLLQSFPERLLQTLAQAAELLELPPNTQILKQGQDNEHLYFLVEGQVGVYVDSGRVSKLQRKGDLLGEMSVISNRTVGATILSETRVVLVKVNARLFLDMQGKDRDLCISVLYRIYATVLAEKLATTNQKAKHFEELTLQLTATQAELEEINQNLERKVEERTQRLEAQNAELMASKNKMEELLNSKRMIFQKLSEFHDRQMIPLKKFLDEIRQRHPEEAAIQEARRVVFEVQRQLSPLTDLYSTEQAIQSKRVLLADSNKKQQIIAKMALGGTGVILDIASTVEEGRIQIQEQKYDLVVIDSKMLELGNIAYARDPKMGLVLMTSDEIPAYLPELKKLVTVPYLVSRDEGDRTFTVKNILTTVTKVLTQDFFGLEKYLIWGVDIQSQPVISSLQRADVIAEVDGHFERLGVRRANRDRIRAVLEEMLMNAIYDAPAKDGTSLYNHLPRTQNVSLKPEEQGLVRYATDGMVIGVSVQDPFGSLKGSTILKYLEHNYSGRAGELNAAENKGGAGRGLHQIVENSDLVVFNVEPGRKTEAIALFNVDVKEATAKIPSFHLFIKS